MAQLSTRAWVWESGKLMSGSQTTVQSPKKRRSASSIAYFLLTWEKALVSSSASYSAGSKQIYPPCHNNETFLRHGIFNKQHYIPIFTFIRQCCTPTLIRFEISALMCCLFFLGPNSECWGTLTVLFRVNFNDGHLRGIPHVVAGNDVELIGWLIAQIPEDGGPLCHEGRFDHGHRCQF